MLQVACVPYIIGWILVCLATNIWYIYVSRLLVGSSHAFILTSIYAVEISTKDNMRATSNFHQGVASSLGSIIVFFMGMFFRWKIIAYIGWIFPFVAGIWLCFCPESPVFLINKNTEEESHKVLQRLRSSEESAKEGKEFKQYFNNHFIIILHLIVLDYLRNNHQCWMERQRLGEESRDNQENIQYKIFDYIWYKRSYKQFLTRKELYRPLFFITFLSFIQQFSGMTVITSYVVKMFNEIGKFLFILNQIKDYHQNSPIGSTEKTVKVKNMAYVSAIIMAVVRLIASLSLSSLSKLYQRRSLYFTSAGLTILSLLLVGTSLFFTHRYIIVSNVQESYM